MSEQSGGTSNTAENGSRVGIQAGHVQDSQVTFIQHQSNEYYVAADATPEEKFTVGVAYLEGGVPAKALSLIDEAIANGYDNAKVRLYSVLSLLHKRSCSDLDDAEQRRLDDLPRYMNRYPDDDWEQALSVVCVVLEETRGSHVGQPDVLTRLEDLPSLQRGLIVHHLDLVLTTAIKERFWSQTRHSAELDQKDHDRLGRVWAYFQPDPVEPREAAVPRRWEDDHVEHSWWWSAALLGCSSALGWALVTTQVRVPVALLVLTLALGSMAILTAQERRFRHLLHQADPTQPRSRRPPEPGFEKQVRNDFEYYAHKYAPTSDKRRWLADTNPIRAALWEEIIETYGDCGIRADGLRWLVRHLVLRTKEDWKNGQLYAHRKLHRITRTISCSWVIFLIGTVLLAQFTGQFVFRTSAPIGVLLVITAVCAGRTGVSWVHVFSERRFAAEQRRRRQEDLGERHAEYSRWQERLDRVRPSEVEMERWLDCDKTLILAEALKVYRLAWQDVIAYAFLQTPGDSHQRARVSWGPSRYSRYSMRLFLITKEGVREFVTELDFQEARWEVRERNNFRFDAISSVRVIETGARQCTLDLTLSNGPSRKIYVRDATPDITGEDQDVLKEVDLDAAGFSHALHVLEGIAAEGKGWLGRGRLGA